MQDLISRQVAIDALDVLCQEHRYKIPGKSETYSQYNEAWQDALDRAEGAIFNLPSAQPERKRGKWIAVTEDGDVYKRICSCCGREAFFQNDDPDELYDGGRYELSDFCPHCGAEMSKK